MRLLKLMAVLGLDGRGFKAGLKEAESGAGKFARGLKSQIAGAFSAGAMLAWTKNVINTASRIKDLSEQYRISTDEMQRLEFAAQQSGLQFEDFAQTLQKVGNAREAAVKSNTALRSAFDAAHVSLEDLNNPMLRNYDILLKLSEGMKGATINTRDQAELTDVLGQRSDKLLSTLQQLSTIKPPDLISAEAIERLDKADKLYQRIWNYAKVKTANQLETIGILYGIGGDPIEEMERKSRAEGAKPLTKEEIEAANVAKRERLAKQAHDASQGLWEVDKDAKEKAGIDDVGKTFGKAFEIKAPSLGGLAGAGGFSGGIAGIDPSLFIERNQLTELKALNAKVAQLQTLIGTKISSVATLGTLTR